MQIISRISFYSFVLALALPIPCKSQPYDPHVGSSRKAIYVTTGDSGSTMNRILGLLKSRLTERSKVAFTSGNQKSDFTIELTVKEGLGADGFSISSKGEDWVEIRGNDYKGLLYGVGKFLRTSAYIQDSFVPGKWRGTSVPEKKVRGIYFATHFYNYYQTAPIEEVQRYIEDLALWGVNSLMVWFDMNHFNGIKDPEAQILLTRLKRYMETARSLDLAIGFIAIGNEGYSNSPEELRAVPGGGRGGYYSSAICPNKPGGMEYILSNSGAFFDEIKYLQPHYICIWPYDQGGCGSDCCQPWGANGFMKCAKAISSLAKKKIPGIKTILSTWYFDKKEWEGIKDKLPEYTDWADLLLAESIDGYYDIVSQRSTHDFPVVGFPEISMHQTFPWGGFGATPLPNRVKAQWEKVHNKLDGGFPYSEGVFEDISKVVCAQLYWNNETSPDSVIKEYINYEFAPDSPDPLLKVISVLEKNHHYRWWPGKLEGVKLLMDWFPSKNTPQQEDPGAEEAYDTVKRMDENLPAWAKDSWRWRILYLRTMLDAELKMNSGVPNERALQGFEELMKIYHTTKNTDPVVKPPIPFR